MRTAAATFLILAALTLTGCETTYTFEADPEGGSGNEFTGDPTKIRCFMIEADAPSDDGDKQLGTFCKVANR